MMHVIRAIGYLRTWPKLCSSSSLIFATLRQTSRILLEKNVRLFLTRSYCTLLSCFLFLSCSLSYSKPATFCCSKNCLSLLLVVVTELQTLLRPLKDIFWTPPPGSGFSSGLVNLVLSGRRSRRRGEGWEAGGGRGREVSRVLAKAAQVVADLLQPVPVK